MSAGRDLDEVHGELATEHRTIMALITRIEGEREVADLSRLLDELHGSLIDHFAHEQFPGGLYERMGAMTPAYHEDIRTLVRDHCLILSSVSALLERSQSGRPGRESELLQDVAAMTRALHEHEHREHLLVEKLKSEAAR